MDAEQHSASKAEPSQQSAGDLIQTRQGQAGTTSEQQPTAESPTADQLEKTQTPKTQTPKTQTPKTQTPKTQAQKSQAPDLGEEDTLRRQLIQPEEPKRGWFSWLQRSLLRSRRSENPSRRRSRSREGQTPTDPLARAKASRMEASARSPESPTKPTDSSAKPQTKASHANPSQASGHPSPELSSGSSVTVVTSAHWKQKAQVELQMALIFLVALAGMFGYLAVRKFFFPPAGTLAAQAPQSLSPGKTSRSRTKRTSLVNEPKESGQSGVAILKSNQPDQIQPGPHKPQAIVQSLFSSSQQDASQSSPNKSDANEPSPNASVTHQLAPRRSHESELVSRESGLKALPGGDRVKAALRVPEKPPAKSLRVALGAQQSSKAIASDSEKHRRASGQQALGPQTVPPERRPAPGVPVANPLAELKGPKPAKEPKNPSIPLAAVLRSPQPAGTPAQANTLKQTSQNSVGSTKGGPSPLPQRPSNKSRSPKLIPKKPPNALVERAPATLPKATTDPHLRPAVFQSDVQVPVGGNPQRTAPKVADLSTPAKSKPATQAKGAGVASGQDNAPAPAADGHPLQAQQVPSQVRSRQPPTPVTPKQEPPPAIELSSVTDRPQPPGRASEVQIGHAQASQPAMVPRKLKPPKGNHSVASKLKVNPVPQGLASMPAQPKVGAPTGQKSPPKPRKAADFPPFPDPKLKTPVDQVAPSKPPASAPSSPPFLLSDPPNFASPFAPDAKPPAESGRAASPKIRSDFSVANPTPANQAASDPAGRRSEGGTAGEETAPPPAEFADRSRGSSAKLSPGGARENHLGSPARPTPSRNPTRRGSSFVQPKVAQQQPAILQPSSPGRSFPLSLPAEMPHHGSTVRTPAEHPQSSRPKRMVRSSPVAESSGAASIARPTAADSSRMNRSKNKKNWSRSTSPLPGSLAKPGQPRSNQSLSNQALSNQALSNQALSNQPVSKQPEVGRSLPHKTAGPKRSLERTASQPSDRRDQGARAAKATSTVDDSQGPAELYRVRVGDNYWTISERLYGTGQYFRALRAWHRQERKQVLLQAQKSLQLPQLETLRKRFPSLCPPEQLADQGVDFSDAATARLGSRNSVRKNSGTRPSEMNPTTLQSSLTNKSKLQGRLYQVKEGETLFGIARQELGDPGRWIEIYRLNRERLGDRLGRLPAGLSLTLPGDGAHSARSTIEAVQTALPKAKLRR